MLVIGLTGGIGAGKSTVGMLLERRGAVRIDADAIACQVVEPGEAAHEAVARRFGEDLLDGERNIDRVSLARIVFSDQQALSDLEAIVHPAVNQIVNARLALEEPTDHVVILEIPLLIGADGTRRRATDGVLVVDAAADITLERLVAHRAMDEHDAQRRIAAQIPREVRLRAADFVILNIGTTDELDQMVDEAWRWIETLRRQKQAPSTS